MHQDCLGTKELRRASAKKHLDISVVIRLNKASNVALHTGEPSLHPALQISPQCPNRGAAEYKKMFFFTVRMVQEWHRLHTGCGVSIQNLKDTALSNLLPLTLFCIGLDKTISRGPLPPTILSSAICSGIRHPALLFQSRSTHLQTCALPGHQRNTAPRRQLSVQGTAQRKLPASSPKLIIHC